MGLPQYLRDIQTDIAICVLQAARAGSVLADDAQPIQNANHAGSEENAAKILTYEEAFKQIKEATGVSDTAEVVERSVDVTTLILL